MAYGSSALRRIQVSNAENTPGTAEAATAILFGTATIPTQSQIFHTPEQDRNSLAEIVELPFKVAEGAEFEFEGDAYADLLLHLLSMAVRGNVTGVSAGGLKPNEIIWTFEPSLSGTLNTPDQTDGIDTRTFELGDNINCYKLDFCYVVSIEISGDAGDDEDSVVMVKATIGAQSVTEGSFTGALTEVAAAYFPANLVKLFIDTSYAGLGGTQKSGVLKGWKWTLDTKFTRRFVADGTYAFAALNEDKKAPELELTYVRDSTIVEAELDKYQATPKTKTFIRIGLTSNAAEMDSGQANVPYCNIDGAYVYTEWPPLDEEDGTSLVTVKARGVKDSTSSKMMTVTVGTLLAAFP